MAKVEVYVTLTRHGNIIVDADPDDEKSVEDATNKYLAGHHDDASGDSGVDVVEDEGWVINSEGWKEVE